ncbi:hypothetical protein AJ78_05504 [Emergomyces pasteurianus Ep9510]|uniref:Protein kinase domain-containing protein n=1 Tax=Emergomyces pasteurianus Ep9510 TaxID=1447872 RepID=A0A1J9PC97_9EURO|nr:hypothetical protein AJ78_05504 [Emergomyces pasteurianus Ep9510]
MAQLFRLEQLLKGKSGCYTITKELQEGIWLATYRSQNEQPVLIVIKGVRHFRLKNEREVLHHFQNRTSFIRPLLDEIIDPSDPPAIVLRRLDDHLLNASSSRKLTTHEVKYIAKRILKALKVLHGDGFVHTYRFPSDVKPDNFLINYQAGDIRFSDVQLADLGSTVPAGSAYAKDGDMIGAPIWRSPEAHLQIGWAWFEIVLYCVIRRFVPVLNSSNSASYFLAKHSNSDGDSHALT